MKSAKKLLMATLMLVVAFVAATSATFAWFTVSQEAKVDDIELKAADAGTDLQISMDGSKFGYYVDLNEMYSFGGTLLPSTFDKTTEKFYTLAINENDDNRYKYVNVNDKNMAVAKGENAPQNAAYVAFDLWFKTSNTNINTVNLEVEKTTIKGKTENDTIVDKTVRVMFEVYNGETVANRVIYEPNYNANGTYGVGSYFAQGAYIAYNAFTGGTPFADLDEASQFAGHGNNFLGTFPGEGQPFTLAESFKTKAEYTTAKQTTGKLEIASVNTTTAVKVRVYIWIEGWDGDTTNNAAAQSFLAGFVFSGSTK